MRRALFGGLVALALAAACAAPHGQLSPALRDQSRLQADELLSLGEDAILYDVIARLRHRWIELASVDRALPEATDQIGVYAGTSLLGGVNELHYIQVRNVTSVRFIGPREAAALYGPGHASGVIVVYLK